MSKPRIRTKTPGVYSREHESRKHGVRLDRYFLIRHTVNGKQIEEGLGWASQGWTESKAGSIRAELAENRRRGEGPYSLDEKRKTVENQRQLFAQQKEIEATKQITFSEIFNQYKTNSLDEKKSRTWQTEEGLFKHWIKPSIGHKPLKDIVELDLTRIERTMKKTGRAPRSIEYCLAVVRQVFNWAGDVDLFTGKNPCTRRKKKAGGRFDNRRVKYLTREEANSLLAKLATISQEVHDMTLLSLNTGMRAGEIFSLNWADVDLNRKQLTIRDTKNTQTRHTFLNNTTEAIFLRRVKRSPDELVFPNKKGNKYVQISKTFNRAVDSLGLNDGITDRRQKVTFHSCRHTFASWLLEETDADIYQVKILLGHQDIRMTERYSHVAENTLADAIGKLDNQKSASY